VSALPCLKTGVGMHRRAARGRDEPSLVQALGLLATAYVIARGDHGVGCVCRVFVCEALPTCLL
jgi:hypothetical protein